MAKAISFRYWSSQIGSVGRKKCPPLGMDVTIDATMGGSSLIAFGVVCSGKLECEAPKVHHLPSPYPREPAASLPLTWREKFQRSDLPFEVSPLPLVVNPCRVPF